MPPRPPLPEDIAAGIIATVELPPTGPFIVTLTTDDPNSVPDEAVHAVAAELERLAPSRVTFALLSTGTTIGALSDNDLAAIGLTRTVLYPVGPSAVPRSGFGR